MLTWPPKTLVSVAAWDTGSGNAPSGKNQGSVTLVLLVEGDIGNADALGNLSLRGFWWPASLMGTDMAWALHCGCSEAAHYREPRALGNFGNRRNRLVSFWILETPFLCYSPPEANFSTLVLSLRTSLGNPEDKYFSCLLGCTWGDLISLTFLNA